MDKITGNLKKTIICFGDSNTHGYNSYTMGRFNEEERWPALLEKYLGNGYKICEEGLEGRTCAFRDPLYEGLSGFDMIFQCLMTHKPVDLLIIMLGTNDVKERFSATPENISRGLERLINKALTTTQAFRHEKPNILIMTPPPIEEGYEKTYVAGEMGKNCVAKSKALAPLFREIAERYHCHYLDLGAMNGISMYPYDYMHLSLEAHNILATNLADYIKKIF